jgi:hypothetical protein
MRTIHCYEDTQQRYSVKHNVTLCSMRLFIGPRLILNYLVFFFEGYVYYIYHTKEGVC